MAAFSFSTTPATSSSSSSSPSPFSFAPFSSSTSSPFSFSNPSSSPSLFGSSTVGAPPSTTPSFGFGCYSSPSPFLYAISSSSIPSPFSFSNPSSSPSATTTGAPSFPSLFGPVSASSSAASSFSNLIGASSSSSISSSIATPPTSSSAPGVLVVSASSSSSVTSSASPCSSFSFPSAHTSAPPFSFSTSSTLGKSTASAASISSADSTTVLPADSSIPTSSFSFATATASPGLQSSSGLASNLKAASTTVTTITAASASTSASKTSSFPAFGVTSTASTAASTGSGYVPSFESPTIDAASTGTSSSFVGFQTPSQTAGVNAPASQLQSTAASSLSGQSTAASSLFEIISSSTMDDVKFGAKQINDEAASVEGKDPPPDMVIINTLHVNINEDNPAKKERKNRKQRDPASESTKVEIQLGCLKSSLVKKATSPTEGGGSSTNTENISCSYESADTTIPVVEKGKEKMMEKENSEYTKSEDGQRVKEKREKEIYVPSWKVFKNKGLDDVQSRRSFVVHALPAGERLKLGTLNNAEISQGLDQAIIQMLGYSMEAGERWVSQMHELEKKNEDLADLSESLNKVRQSMDTVKQSSEKFHAKEREYVKEITDLKKDSMFLKAEMDQRRKERDNFKTMVKWKKQENQRLQKQIEEIKRRNEEKISKVKEEANEKINILEEKHKNLVEELAKMKAERDLAEEAKEKFRLERVWCLRDGFPLFVHLLHNSPEYLKGTALMRKSVMAMGDAEASKIWKQAFIAGSLNEEMLKIDQNANELFLDNYSKFNETKWPFVQKVISHAEAAIDQVKALRPDGI